MIFETCLTILTAAERATKLYDWFTGARLGKRAEIDLERRRRDDPGLIKISDHIFVDTALCEVKTVANASTLQEVDVLRRMLEPMAEATSGPVLASQVLETPQRLRDQFDQDPWKVLIDVRPAHRVRPDPPPDWVPIAFQDGGIPYIGWQMQGALPQLFNCDFEPDRPAPTVPSWNGTRNGACGIAVQPLGRKAQVFEAFSQLSTSGYLYLGANLPTALHTARLAMRVSPREEAWAFAALNRADRIVTGLLITDAGLHYSNPAHLGPERGFLPWEDFARMRIEHDGERIWLGGVKICGARAYLSAAAACGALLRLRDMIERNAPR